MKRNFLHTLLLMLLCVIEPLFAEGGIGTSGADFLELTTSSRALGMGEAFTAVSEDMSAIYYNPAVTGTLFYPELSFTHQELIEDSRLEHISYSMPLKDGSRYYGHFYAGQTLFWVPPFEKTDIDGENDGDVYFINSATALGYGYKIGSFSVGTTLKYVYQKVDTLNLHSLAADFGVLGALQLPSPFVGPEENFFLGASISNLGTNAKEDPLPRKLRLGASYLPISWARVNLDLNENIIRPSDIYDFTYGLDESLEINSGVEFTYYRLVSFRGGYRFNDAGGYTLGAGFHYAVERTAFRIDMALAETREFGPIYSIQASVMLVPKITSQDMRNAEKHYINGIKYYVDDDLDNAISSFEKAKSYNPYYKDIDRKLEELDELKKLKAENKDFELE